MLSRLDFYAAIAGVRIKKSSVADETPIANDNTRQFTLTSIEFGSSFARKSRSGGSDRTTTPAVANATQIPPVAIRTSSSAYLTGSARVRIASRKG